MSSSSGAETRQPRWREPLDAWRRRAATHGMFLGQLWSSSAISTGANALALGLIVSRVSESTFAAYAAAQVVTSLALAWTDGGVSGGLQLLASQEGRGRARWEAFRVAGFSMSLRITVAMMLPLAAIVIALHAFAKVVVGVPIGVLALFAATGLIQARSLFCSSLVYAAGGFGSYSAVQIGAPLLRLALVSAALFFLRGGSVGLVALLACDLVSSAFGWWLASRSLRSQRKGWEPTEGGGSSDALAIRRELGSFVRPSFQATVLTSLSGVGGTLAGSFFASPPAVAIYSLFLKVCQMMMVAVGPLASYVARRFRLAVDDSARARKNRLLLVGLGIAYPPVALLAMACYLTLGRWIHHYVFAYPWCFALFLCVNGLGTAYALLDLVLASWGEAGHRPLASWLGLGKLVLLFCLRPASAAAL
ncbi:MAG: hypothetical protein PHO89_07075, partial [Methylacidiphilaceae bacterium]|nr:hypothetical protein [Candidatus Methylacidiphilaceae bacterium]